MEAQSDADRELMPLEADPFSLDARREIEEAIQQQAMLDKREHALEHSSEVLGRVMVLQWVASCYASVWMLIYRRTPSRGIHGQWRTIDCLSRSHWHVLHV